MYLVTVIFLASFLCLGNTENDTSNEYSVENSDEYYLDEYNDEIDIDLEDEEEECMPRGGPPPPPPDEYDGDPDSEPAGPQRAGRARRRRRQRNRTQRQRQRNQRTRRRRKKSKKKNTETESENSKVAPTRAARTSRSVDRRNSVLVFMGCAEYRRQLKREFENMKRNGLIEQCTGRNREDCMMRGIMKVRMEMKTEFPECKEQAMMFYDPLSPERE